MLIIPDIQSEDELRELLRQRTLTAPTIKHDPVPANHKWRLASALQKSIRRGKVEFAIDCTLKLFGIDPRYTWHRLGVIALEDIGFGSLVDVAVTLECIRSTSFRRNLGEIKCLAATATTLANATKSRAMDDALCMDPDRKFLPAKEWRAKVEQMDLPFLVQFTAIRGHSYYHFGQLIPEFYELLSRSHVQIVTHSPDPYGEEMIGGQLAASWDQFTREGKAAIRRLAQHRALPDYVRVPSNGSILKVLGLAVFEVEGGHLNRSIVNDDLHDLAQTSFDAQYRQAGLDSRKQMNGIRSFVERHRAALNDARVAECQLSAVSSLAI